MRKNAVALPLADVERLSVPWVNQAVNIMTDLANNFGRKLSRITVYHQSTPSSLIARLKSLVSIRK
jgi:hypothetical protein